MTPQPDRRRVAWQFWAPQILVAITYLATAAYAVGIFSQRIATLERSVDNLTLQVQYLTNNVQWRK